MHWHWQINEEVPLRRPWFIHSPYDWELAPEEERLYVKVFEETYMAFLSDKIENFAPAKAWKNAFLICALYDEMEDQRFRGRKTQANKGWSYLRSRRDHAYFMETNRQKRDAEAHEKKYPNLQRQALANSGSSLGAAFSKPVLHMTSGAKAAFEASGEQPGKYLERHISGDFGESNDTSDRELNLQNMASGNMVMSIYTLSTGVRFYIITDAGHKVTTFLLPDEN
jgi:hypothetical protein